MSPVVPIRLLPTPELYDFNASRWVWTGNSQRRITWVDISWSDEQGISLKKIIRIATLAIFAFIYDLLRMAFNRQQHPRQQNIKALQADLRKQNMQELQAHLPPDLFPIVLANFSKDDAAFMFDQTAEIQRLADLYRPIDFDEVNGAQLRSIQNHPKPDDLYPLIRNLDLRDEPISDSDFLKIIDKLSNAKLRKLYLPRFLDYETIEKTLEKINQSNLERICFNTHLTGEEFTNLVPKIKNLKELVGLPPFIKDNVEVLPGLTSLDLLKIQIIESFQHSLETINLHGATDLLFTRLLNCPNLKKLTVNCIRTPWEGLSEEGPALELAQRGQLTAFHLNSGKFPFFVLKEICQNCELEELSLGTNPTQFFDEEGFSEIFKHCKKLRFFRSGALKDEHLKALATDTKDLTFLDLNIRKNQVQLFLDLLPHWEKLDTLSVIQGEPLEINDLVDIIKKRPSLKNLSFRVEKYEYSPEAIQALKNLNRPPNDGYSRDVIRALGNLNRPLTLYIPCDPSNYPQDLAEFCREFPSLTVKFRHIPEFKV